MKALKSSPDNHNLRYNVAKLQIENNMFNEAYDNYEVLYQKTKNIETIDLMIECLINLNDLNKAIQIVDSKINSSSNWAKAYLRISKEYDKSNDLDNALKYYELAVKYDKILRDYTYELRFMNLSTNNQNLSSNNKVNTNSNSNKDNDIRTNQNNTNCNNDNFNINNNSNMNNTNNNENKRPVLKLSNIRKNNNEKETKNDESKNRNNEGSKEKLKVLNFSNGEDQRDYTLYENTDYKKVDIGFKDVAGLRKVKENIYNNIIAPIKNPFLYKTYGKTAGGGILLYGPPGCGKTFISMATAGECDAHFFNISITDILDMYIGSSEKNLNEIFETARKKAPSIIFIDEIDAIGGSRQESRTNALKMLTNQLLIELDKTRKQNDSILVIGATNMPWSVDNALRRPGRFDRVMLIPPPDYEARVELLRLDLQNRPHTDVDFKFLAQKTKDFSGADLKALCDKASDLAIKKSMETNAIIPLNTHYFMQALNDSKATTLEWLNTAKNYATYANESGIYDEILEYLKSNKY
jgi:SpoVK/Ycf46/Vps4 family AAA+-type ATPase